MITRCFVIGGLMSLTTLVACSGDDDSSGNNGSGNNGASGSGGSSATGGTGIDIGFGGSAASSQDGGGAQGNFGGSGATGGNANACEPQADESGCVGEQYGGETTPLDIYIMFDQSCSMSCPAERGGSGLCCIGGPNPRIDHVRNAIAQFLQDPASAGIGVGIGYFGYMDAGRTSCDPSDYSTPAVPMGLLPGHAPAILNSLNSIQPTGETPTGAAIRGACTYASQWRQRNPRHKTVVLLVTDGIPEAPVTSDSGGCTPTIDDAAEAAATCFESSHQLPVYVLGVGQALSNLDRIAVAGGTNQAYIVSGGDVVAQVLAALNTIRSEASIPCQLAVPSDPTQPINYQQVNLAFCDGAGQNSTFYYVTNAGGCDPQLGGWFYDDPANPQQILMCDATCNRVTVPGGRLLVSVGCATLPIPQ